MILAVDLGKFNSVLCRFEPNTRKTEIRTTGAAWQWNRVKRKTDREDADGMRSLGLAIPSEAIGGSETRGLRCRA